MRPIADEDFIVGFRLSLGGIVRNLLVREDKIRGDELIRQDILELAAGCFKMLEIIGDHPIDRLARELDVDRMYAGELAKIAAINKRNIPAAFIYCCGNAELEERMKERIRQAFDEETKKQETP